MGRIQRHGFQEAYQLGGLIVLPVALLMVAQLSGVLFLDAVVGLLIGAGVAGRRHRAVAWLPLVRPRAAAAQHLG